MDPVTVYSILSSTGILSAIGGSIGRLFAHQPSAFSYGPGYRWIKGWYVGHEPGEADEYPALYTGEATILENTIVGHGIPAARWSNSAKRLIPLQAITSQGIPIFADSQDAEIVEENLDRIWTLSGHTNRENERWAQSFGLLSPGSMPEQASRSSMIASSIFPLAIFVGALLLGHPVMGLVAGGALFLRTRNAGTSGGSR